MPEISSHMYENLLYDREDITNQQKKDESLNK